jgi:hypothetical protein
MNEKQQHFERSLRHIGDVLKRSIPDTVGFALFIATGPEVAYISNGQRPDVVLALEEVLAKMSIGEFVPGTQVFTSTKYVHDETVTEQEARLAMESHCAFLGKTMLDPDGKRPEIALFLFNFGSGGHVAYFMNVDMRGRIRNWVAKYRGQS